MENRETDRIEQHDGLAVPNEQESTVGDAPVAPVVVTDKPVVVPPAPAAAVVASKQVDGARLYVAQWLTYALWWWFAASMTWLVGVVASIMVVGLESAWFSTNVLALPMISTGVSLLAALGVDFYYSRYEPVVKEKGSRLLQVVYSVIFGLTIVGGVVALAYNLFGGFFGADETGDSRTIALITAVAAVAVYGAVFTRVLFPLVRPWVRYVVWAVALIGTVVVLGVVMAGPAGKARDARDDALLEDAVPAIATEINTYAKKNRKLPASLKDLDLSKKTFFGSSDQAKEAVARSLVRYTPNTKTAAPLRSSGVSSYRYSNSSSTPALYYRLCVTYKTEQQGSSSSWYDDDDTDTTPTTRPDTDQHGKGEKCYELVTSTNTYSYPDVLNGADDSEDATAAGSFFGTGTTETKS